jgi:hypothetical protein
VNACGIICAGWGFFGGASRFAPQMLVEASRATGPTGTSVTRVGMQVENVLERNRNPGIE